MRNFLLLLALTLITSCQQEEQKSLMEGDHRGILEVQDGEILPFNFKVRADGMIEIYNAEEVIEVDDIIYSKDSIRINFPVYEGYITGKFSNGKISDAQYIKESLERYVPFHVEYDVADRFDKGQVPQLDVSGNWEMLFSEDDNSTFIAKGIFEQDGHKITGTIRTTTGDYRYLEGILNGGTMKFSAFDGAHAFLFTAEVTDNGMSGYFYSGNHYKASFRANRNADFELPHEDTLTFLREGYDKFEFAFPDADGRVLTLNDVRFKGKVVLVQIMGSWCPNCLDESKYYAQYYRDHKDEDLEFVALAFEYAKTREKAFAGIKRLKERLDIEYPILLAQLGSSSKTKAQEKLPMLNHVLSYPTTIFIDKKGEVRKIHTGFNGPATGEKYVAFQKEFDDFVKKLLNE